MDGLLSLVIPVYNEADSLVPLVAEIDEALASFGSPYEIVFVDDGSSDGSFAVMKELAEARDDVRVVKLRRNFGKAAALSHGFLAARGDYIVTMDGDRQDDPAEIANLTAPLAEGYDLVSGWKQRRQDPLNKTLPSRFFNWTVRKASGIPLHDFNCGLKAYNRDVTDTIFIYGELHRYIPVVAAQGTRDAFGGPAELRTALGRLRGAVVEVAAVPGADHGLKVGRSGPDPGPTLLAAALRAVALARRE